MFLTVSSLVLTVAQPEPSVMLVAGVALLTVVFAAIVPLAAKLYLTVTTNWTLEPAVLHRRFSAALIE